MKLLLLLSLLAITSCGLGTGSGGAANGALITLGQKITVDWDLKGEELKLATNLCSVLTLKNQNYYNENFGKTLYFHLLDTQCNAFTVQADIPMQVTNTLNYSAATTPIRFFQIVESMQLGSLAYPLCNELLLNPTAPKRAFQTGFNITKQYYLNSPTSDSITLTAVQANNLIVNVKEEVTFLTLTSNSSQLGVELHRVKTATCANGALNRSDTLESYFRR